VQGTFTQPWLRIYTSPDPAGVEIAGAAKNVIALAAGMLDGLGLGFNAKSALLARGLAELVRLGVAQGARADTLFGVAGVGDLATTCFCPEGRNRTLGEAIGKGGSLEQAQQATQSVVEGVETARALHELARARGISVPIIDAVHRVLFQGQPPAEAVRDLMTRAAGSERIG
jgi:glycerol-3-phosphate dehydrogenase (NAD(P)+)